MTLIKEEKVTNVIKTEVEEVIDGIIYKATNIKNGLVYIGQTRTGLKARIKSHISDARRENRTHLYFHKNIRKYGEEAFKWEEIDYASTLDELNTKEIYWIAYYNAHGTGGYNLTDGGDGATGYKVTKDGIQRRKDVFNKMWANGHVDTVLRGEDAPNSLLKDKEVKEIIDMLIKGEIEIKEIANRYNVNRSIIHGIQSGKSRKHLITDDELKEMQETKKKWARGTEKLTDDDVIEIKNLLLYTDINSLEIYDMFNINKANAASVMKRKKWSHLFTEDEIFKIKNRKIKNGKSKFEPSKKDIVKIKILLLQKELKIIKIFHVGIAKALNVPDRLVRNVGSGRTHRHITLPENYKDLPEYQELIDSKILKE